jgi:hypothetical protein
MSELIRFARCAPLRKNYIRLIHPPDGDREIDDIYRADLEGCLEASDKPLTIIYSQKQWQEFLQEVLRETPCDPREN